MAISLGVIESLKFDVGGRELLIGVSGSRCIVERFSSARDLRRRYDELVSIDEGQSNFSWQMPTEVKP